MKPALKILTIAVNLCFFCAALSADTGTYEILDYRVKLTPKPNGSVEIEYYQRWFVTGGNIPWVTVGVPNRNFKIIPYSNKKNAARVDERNTDNWSGVYVTLDKKYDPGETFEVSFSIVQNQLFYEDGNNYTMVFRPGWYNRAKTDLLHIELFPNVNPDLIKVSPQPDRIENQNIIWERKNLGPGKKFKISYSVPKALMSGTIITGERYSPFTGVPWPAVIFITFFSILFLFLIIYALIYRFRCSYGNGPELHYGGLHYIIGAGHGWGSSCVCACACAGCACACACAGGSAAGCERKLSPQCALCRQCDKKKHCPLWNRAA